MAESGNAPVVRRRNSRSGFRKEVRVQIPTPAHLLSCCRKYALCLLRLEKALAVGNRTFVQPARSCFAASLARSLLTPATTLGLWITYEALFKTVANIWDMFRRTFVPLYSLFDVPPKGAGFLFFVFDILIESTCGSLPSEMAAAPLSMIWIHATGRQRVAAVLVLLPSYFDTQEKFMELPH